MTLKSVDSHWQHYIHIRLCWLWQFWHQCPRLSLSSPNVNGIFRKLHDYRYKLSLFLVMKKRFPFEAWVVHVNPSRFSFEDSFLFMFFHAIYSGVISVVFQYVSSFLLHCPVFLGHFRKDVKFVLSSLKTVTWLLWQKRCV